MVLVSLLLLFSLFAPTPTLALRAGGATRALALHADKVASAPGYFTLHFRGPCGNALLHLLEAELGEPVRDFVPPNAVLVFIESAERGEALLRRVPHLVDVRRVVANSAARVRARIASFARAVAFAPIWRNESAHAALRETDGLARPAAAGEARFARGALNNAPVVQLRVDARATLSDADLQRLAQGACRTDVSVADGDGRGARLLGNVHCDDADAVAYAVERDARVLRVELREPFETLNSWAVDSLHSAASDSAIEGSTKRLPLTGAQQILSLSDTGVAPGSCFFSDTRAVPLVNGFASVPPDSGHRKFRAYSAGSGGDFDDARGGGHGTHVAGTAVGRAATNAANSVRDFDGGAPDARLCVVDLLPDDGAFLRVPLDIGGTILQWSMDCGARVHSASWGADTRGVYSADDEAVDRFAFEHRHFLPIFAAGNGGERAGGSIVSPSLAKNALSVGATMNGVEASRFSGFTPTRPDLAYSPRYLASFSARGSASLPFRKPDVVAPGGAYVWSASSTSDSCSRVASAVVGLQGTSMATPLVAAGALLLREAFVALERDATTNVDVHQPTASLLRATMAASTVPLDGVFPERSFSSRTERIEAEGHGRVALDRVLGERASLYVLSNEEAPLGRSHSHTWCVALPTDAVDATVALAYADYPSSSATGVRATIVNDLRLSVIAGDAEFVVNQQPNVAEQRSTIERVTLGREAAGARVALTVHADAINFGDTQTYSLVVAVQYAEESAAASGASISEMRADSLTCTLCGDENFVHESECAVCGNGVVEDGEECDSSTCCDSATCTLLDDGSVCTVYVGNGCRLQGACRADLNAREPCALDASLAYRIADDSSCETVPGDGTDAPCVAKTVDEWLALLGGPGAPVDIDADQFCCRPLRAAFEHIEFEHLFASLARHFAAALLNSQLRGAQEPAELLLAIEEARALLEQHCGVGFIDLETRHTAEALLDDLALANARCSDADRDEATDAGVCTQNALARRVCSGGGTYERDTGTCLCHASRQPNEPDCAHKHCSGNGVSLYDYAMGAERCVCERGWRGEQCDECATSDALADSLVYHCVGLPIALVGGNEIAAPQKRLLQLVERASVRTRLSNAFYGNVIKHADAVPGRTGVDCACREPQEQPVWQSARSHRDAVVQASRRAELLDALALRADALFASNGARRSQSSASMGGNVPPLAALAAAALARALY